MQTWPVTSLPRSAVVAPRPWVALVVLVWIPAVLLLDHGAALPFQTVLGVGTWVLLLAVLRGLEPLVRAQAAVVVVFATMVEYTFSPLLHVYEYRLHTVPAFVPPGHGLVYLAALALGAAPVVRRHARLAITVTVVAGGLYALWGLSPWAPRADVLGAFWYACLVGFLAFGRSRMLYVGAFAVVTYLELLGTSLGNWAWAPRDPTGLVTMGNPPSGAAGGYGWFDLAAVLGAPVVLAATARVTARRRAAAGLPATVPVPADAG